MFSFSKWKGFFFSCVDKFVELFADLVSSRLLFIVIIIFTLSYMFWQTTAHHPFDKFEDGFPRLILTYTVWYAWVEGIIKVAQKKQTTLDRQAMDNLRRLIEDAERRDRQMEELTKQILELVELKRVLQHVEKAEGKSMLRRKEHEEDED